LSESAWRHDLADVVAMAEGNNLIADTRPAKGQGVTPLEAGLVGRALEVFFANRSGSDQNGRRSNA
jgi:hypothetical protein